MFAAYESTANILLNKKNEWNGNRIPRLRVEVQDKIDENEEEQKDESYQDYRNRLLAKLNKTKPAKRSN